MSKSKFKEKVLEVSGGVVSYLGDLLLFMVTYGVELSTAGLSGSGSRNASGAYARAMKELYGIETSSTSKGFENLKRKGHIKYSRGDSNIEITAAGRKRLQRSVPIYEKKRKWDGRLYLVTYDIPEHKKQVRDRFREWLKQIGCGMLQASVWITPYDPREVLEKYIRYNRLEGDVLISYTGKGGSIAGESMRELLSRVYHLNRLNERYQEFLEQPLEKWPNYRVAFAFYSVLKDDPQLPFELLPEDWAGTEAYRKLSTLLEGRPRSQ